MLYLQEIDQHLSDMKRIVRHVVVFVSVILFAVSIRAQSTIVHGYEFTTGVDTSLWADMSVSTPWGLLAVDMGTPLPFTFSIWNRNYNELVFYPDGTMLFRHQIRSMPSAFFPDSTQKLEPVAAGVFAYSRRRNYTITMLSTDIDPDSVGHRSIVFQMTSDSSGISRRWQVRLSEEDNSITLIYDDIPGSDSYPAHIGLMLDTGHVIMVNPVSHTASATATEPSTAWPGRGRYYRFTPTEELCATPAGLQIEKIRADGTGVQMSWRPSIFYTSYRVEYGQPGFVEGEGTTVTVVDTTITIQNLTPEEDIEVRVHGMCTDSCSGYISMIVHLETVDTTVIHGYRFTSGVSSQLWYDMSSATGVSSEFYSFPFPVFLNDRFHYRQFCCYAGPLLLTAKNPYCFHLEFPHLDCTEHVNGYLHGQFVSRELYLYNSAEMCGVYGHLCKRDAYNYPNILIKVKCVNTDSVGHRVFVAQQSNQITPYVGNNWQIQMREDDHSVTLVYGEPFFENDSAARIGLLLDTNHLMVVNQDSHTVSPQYDGVVRRAWPGHFRYYSFVPVDTLCPHPVLSTRGVSLSTNATMLLWERCPFHTSFTVEYGPAGFTEGSGTQVTTNDTSLLLQGLLPDVEYEARVTAWCSQGNSRSSNIFFRTPCNDPPGNQLYFANLYADSVKCSIGNYNTPSGASSPPRMVDLGEESVLSRHTAYFDSTDYVWRNWRYWYWHIFEGNCYSWPEGFCSIVRLGNWRTAGDQESVTYTLVVDTERYDLLILHYALAEGFYRNSHYYPHFELSIADSVGGSLGNCYYHDLVDSLLWPVWHWHSDARDICTGWESVGMNLAPLQGRTILLTLSHADHDYIGNAYYTLETAKRRITAESCGDEVVGTFRAPKGFNYRWYSLTDTATTLSTADTLRVTVPGDYGCHVTSRFCSEDSGFYLRGYAGGRYPAAAFIIQPQDSCGSEMHFTNQSVVSRDSNHTQLTSIPCDNYLWRFDDGTTSTYANPTHTFNEGTHTVTLYAMLAGGDCVDSVSQSFTVTLQHDTLYGSICEGDSYLFFNQRLTESGEYNHIEGCQHTTLYLDVNPIYHNEVSDTLTVGNYCLFDGIRYWQAGVYTRIYTSIHGCDSIVTLRLCCIDTKDTTVCSSSLPLTWEGVSFAEAGSDTLRLTCTGGTDSIVVLNLGVLQ